MHDEAEITARYELAKSLARRAGEMAMDYFNRRASLVIETKAGAQDVVSIADRNVEMLIRDALAQSYPDDGVLGEEFGFSAGTSGFTWVMDPIDGTSPFVFGMPNWCVSIAVRQGARTVIGVVYAPCQDELFAAQNGKGAYLNDERLVLSPAHTLTNAVCGLGSNHRTPSALVTTFVTRLLDRGGMFFRNGSGAMMLAYVAAGRLVGYFEPHMHAWDCLAGFVLIEEAGGWCLPFCADGDLLPGGAVLAAGPGARAELLEVTEGLYG